VLLCDLTPPLKGKVILTGFDQPGKIVYQIVIDVMDYYESTHQILDEDTQLRKKIGVRSVQGQIFNYEGVLDQVFTNTYDEEGTYVDSQINFS